MQIVLLFPKPIVSAFFPPHLFLSSALHPLIPAKKVLTGVRGSYYVSSSTPLIFPFGSIKGHSHFGYFSYLKMNLFLSLNLFPFPFSDLYFLPSLDFLPFDLLIEITRPFTVSQMVKGFPWQESNGLPDDSEWESDLEKKETRNTDLKRTWKEESFRSSIVTSIANINVLTQHTHWSYPCYQHLPSTPERLNESLEGEASERSHTLHFCLLTLVRIGKWIICEDVQVNPFWWKVQIGWG